MDTADGPLSGLVASCHGRTVRCTTFMSSNSLSAGLSYSNVDLLLDGPIPSHQPERAEVIFSDDGTSDAEKFLAKTIGKLSSGLESGHGNTLMRLIFCTTPGYLVRRDILERRLECCPIVESVTTFANDDRRITPLAACFSSNVHLPAILPYAVAALNIRLDQSQPIPQTLKHLDEELLCRLSFEWYTSSRYPQKRVGFIQGREDIESSRRVYEAAKALDIALVVFDQPGHWMEDDRGPHAHFREAFVPLNIDVDEKFVDRVVASVRAYPRAFDGLVTISDARLAGVAAACEQLGFPTETSAAFAIAGDKGATRRLEAASQSISHVVLSGVEELPTAKDMEKFPHFPVVVKPCVGWNSDCVAKCNDETELVAAVERASARHANSPVRSTKVVIEPYISGPEVDANIVLLDGEVLFFEVEDDFPCSGDGDDAARNANFMETQVVLPSKLPPDEIELVQSSLHKSIMRQGFRSGVFHCEARIKNSKSQYLRQDKKSGILDLELHLRNGEGSSDTVSIYLLEINARPPGYLETVAVLLAYGVDYYALHLLFSIGPSGREALQALAHSFLYGPQFHLSMTILPATHGGIMKTEDAVLDLLVRHPGLRENVVDYRTAKKKGDYVEGPDSEALWWIAYASAISRVSREDLLNRVEFIRREFKYEVEQSN